MPELPEVETVRRGLQPVLEGARIVRVEARRPDLRFPLPERFVERLEGRRITALARRAKYLTAHLDAGPVLICHLGMSGLVPHRGRRRDSGHAGRLPPRALEGRGARPRRLPSRHGRREQATRVVFNDPRRFGFMLFANEPDGGHQMLDEPRRRADRQRARRRAAGDLLRDRKAPLKAALLDQRLIAGLGNIYVCEALWRAGLSPRRSAGSIVATAAGKPSRARRAAGGGHPHGDRRGDRGRRLVAARPHVADRRLARLFPAFLLGLRPRGRTLPAPGCGGTIERIVQSGRSTFYCPACQR